MIIISPVDRLEEAEQLLDAGADELYGGVAPLAWGEQFGNLVSSNQRTFPAAQIASLAEFESIVSLVKVRQKSFALTLNAPFYTDKQVDLLVELVATAIDFGIDNVILADIGLLLRLRADFPQLSLHVSTMAHLTNQLAVREYANLGCQRLVLERHMSVEEIAAIAAAVPEVELEVFMLVGKCPNTEGLCSFHHSSASRVWPCEVPYEIVPDSVGALSETLSEAMALQASWASSDRRHACGLCAIPQLMNSEVRGLKLVGRGAPTAQKIANICLTRDFMNLADLSLDVSDYQQRARFAYKKRFGHPCSPNVCYYPEFYRAE